MVKEISQDEIGSDEEVLVVFENEEGEHKELFLTGKDFVKEGVLQKRPDSEKYDRIIIPWSRIVKVKIKKGETNARQNTVN